MQAVDIANSTVYFKKTALVLLRNDFEPSCCAGCGVGWNVAYKKGLLTGSCTVGWNIWNVFKVVSCTVLLIMACSQHLRTFREIGHGKWIGNAI